MAQLSEKELHELAQRAYQAFKKYPNVHAVGLGARHRGGRYDPDELVLSVFVTRKLAPSALPEQDRIPPEFEGFPTDVLELGRRENIDLGDIPGMEADSKDEDETRYRPLKGGAQISGDAMTNAKGTLGLLAKVQGDARVMAVTCYHVFFDNSHTPSAGMRAGNPSTADSCTNCAKGSFGTLAGQDYTAVDAAIAQLDPNTQWLAEVQCIGFITGWNTVTTAQAQSGTYKVRKYGRTTRLTGGIVRHVGLSGSISDPSLPTRSYTNEMLIEPNRPLNMGQAKFGDHGDSGSAVVNAANEIVGVVYAVVLDKSQSLYGWTSAYPVADLATRIQAQYHFTLIPATATRVGDVQTTASALPPTDADRAAAEAAALAHRIERELSNTEQGRMMAALWMRHSYEVGRLVNQNKKVGALWLRHGGPALFQHVVRAAKIRDQAIPSDIQGTPADDCVGALFDVFERYGSDALKSDVRVHRATIPSIAGRSYDDILRSLRDERR